MSKATADELRLLIRSGWRLIVLETFEEDLEDQIDGEYPVECRRVELRDGCADELLD